MSKKNHPHLHENDLKGQSLNRFRGLRGNKLLENK